MNKKKELLHGLTDSSYDGYKFVDMSVDNLGYLSISTQLINPKFCVSRPHRRSTAVSFENNPLVYFLDRQGKLQLNTIDRG